MATENTGIIRESELIQLDGTTDKLIQKLETLNSVLIEVSGTIKQHAGAMATSLQKVNVVTESGKKAVDTAEIAASRLERAYRELEIAMSETGRTIVEVKTQTSQLNEKHRDMAKYTQAMESSYNEMTAHLKILKNQYKELTEEERNNAEIGGRVLQQIEVYAKKVQEIDAILKNHTKVVKESARSAQESAIAQSQEARAVEDMSQQTARDTAEKRKNSQATRESASAANDLASATKVVSTAYGDVTLSMRDYNRYQKYMARADAAAEGSIASKQARWKALTILVDNAANAQGRLSNTTIKLTEESRKYYNEIVKLQEATGRYTLNVGNYRSAWDGLGMSVNQLVRELPSAAISLNTFFVAISNNIPILIDEINKLRRTNELMKKDGKATIPIGKSIVKALFSWQTAIVLVITALSMFGEEIFQAIGKLFRFNRALLTTRKAMNNISKEVKNTNDSYGENLVLFKRLGEAFGKLRTQAEKQKFLEQYRDKLEQVGIYAKNVNDLEHQFSTEGTEEYIQGLQKRARADAAYKLAAEQYEKSLVAKEESKKVQRRLDLRQKVSGPAPMTPWATQGELRERGATEAVNAADRRRIASLKAEADAAEQAGDEYFRLAEAEGVALKPDKEETHSVHVKNLRDLTDQINRMKLSVEEKYQKSMLALQDDGYAKERAALITANKKKNDELRYTLDKNLEWLKGSGVKYKKLTDQQRADIEESNKKINEAILNNNGELYDNLLKLDAKYSITRLGVLKDMISDRLSVVQEGSQEEYALQVASLETQRKLAIAEDALLEKDKQKGEDSINKLYDKQLDYFKGTWSLERLEAQQKLEAEQFAIVQRSTYATQRFELEQERDLLEKKLALANQGLLNMSDVERKTIEAMLGKIDRELFDLNQDVTYQGLLSRLGLTDEAIGGLEKTVDYVIDQMKRILKMEEELRQQQVAQAKTRVDSAQKAYDAEIEARNNGYANNVKTARKELILAKNQQKQKEKLLKEAQERTQRMESALQASSLITASAELWKSFAGIPVVGPVLAMAAISTMWGSFIAAKVKAMQVSKQEYGEGGLEMLEGGSHASGNDINLGVRNRRGRRMHAEGGEALAIINKKQTRKYRNVLPEIVKSLNNGIFEQKFANTFPNITPNLILKSNTDLTNIERSLSDIKRQNENRMMVMPDGTIVRVSRNVVTKIHK